jgi:hypothetical protein
MFIKIKLDSINTQIKCNHSINAWYRHFNKTWRGWTRSIIPTALLSSILFYTISWMDATLWHVFFINVKCLAFCRWLFVMLPFLFLVNVFSVLNRFMVYDYPFGIFKLFLKVRKGNNKITEHRTIFQRERQNS